MTSALQFRNFWRRTFFHFRRIYKWNVYNNFALIFLLNSKAVIQWVETVTRSLPNRFYAFDFFSFWSEKLTKTKNHKNHQISLKQTKKVLIVDFWERFLYSTKPPGFKWHSTFSINNVQTFFLSAPTDIFYESHLYIIFDL